MKTLVPNRPLYPLLALLTALALALGLFWCLWTLALWYRLHPHLPWRDLFLVLDDLLPLLQGEASWQDWRALIEPHYAAHRIAVPRLLVAIDVSFFSGQNHTLYSSAWAGLLACLTLYMTMAKDYFRGDTLSWLFCLGIVSTVFFAPAHLWNLINAINASWHITFACAFAAFFVLLKQPGKPGFLAWTVAYSFATIAAFTTFAGVILWLLLPVLALNTSRRALILTAGFSLLLTVIYTNGLSSDAEIATQWETGSAEIVDRMHTTGVEAIAQNTPPVIVEKAMVLLAWPFSQENPTVAFLLVGLSLLLLGYHGILFLKSQFSEKDEMSPWLKLCVLIATLCLGIALAVQLGRVIEQPNHANGPSFERYNTVVAVYWAGIFGLLLSLLTRLPDALRLTLMTLSLLAVNLLITPNGNYLEQEILSVESAAVLFAKGETPALRDKPGKRLLRFKPEYVYSFEPFFAADKLAYLAPGEQVVPARDLENCNQAVLTPTLSPAPRPGYETVRTGIQGFYGLITRDIQLRDNDALVARLVAKHQGNYAPLALIKPDHNAWEGLISTTDTNHLPLHVYLDTLGKLPFHCRMSVLARKTDPSDQKQG
ncbi:MAG: hypothetical protein V7754_12060 [Halioglobus sp.]